MLKDPAFRRRLCRIQFPFDNSMLLVTTPHRRRSRHRTNISFEIVGEPFPHDSSWPLLRFLRNAWPPAFFLRRPASERELRQRLRESRSTAATRKEPRRRDRWL